MTNVTVHPSNWMSGVEDSTPLHQMSIPGSHESSALHGSGPTQCQSLSITEQLQHGVRFLDVRCVNADVTADDDFPIFHGGVSQLTSFRAVQQECVAFLTRHPSEVILMNVQQEKNPMLRNKPDADFEGKFLRVIDRAHWSFPDWIPQLHEFRGQILLVRPHDVDPHDPAVSAGWTGANLPGGAGLEWNGFNIDGPSHNRFFRTQNGWSRWTKKDWRQNNQDKAVAVTRHLQDAADGQVGADKIYLNFASHAAGAWVGTAASEVNKDVLSYLKTRLTNNAQRLGVLALDFVGNTGHGESLENLVIGHNRFKAGHRFAH